MHSKCYTFVSIFIVLGTLYPLTATAEDLQNDTSQEEVTRANDVTGFYPKAAQCKGNEDCKNGGECNAKNNGTFCSCPEGTEGDFCDRVPSCNDLDCGKGAECKYSKDKKAGVCECKNSRLTFIDDGKKCQECRCKDGYCDEEKGELICKCHKGWGVVPPKGWLDDPYCQKCDCGGEYNCTHTKEGGFFGKTVKKTCLCPVGYEDNSGKCEDKEGNPCSENPCKNGGKCSVVSGKADCTCPDRFTGNFCEKDKCNALTCRNGGTCAIKDGNPVCNCKNGYTGKNCEKDACSAMTCYNRGTCYVKYGKAYCNCTERYSGKNCETDKCDALTCRNGGTCAIKDDTPICNCKDGYTGKNCEKDACFAMTCYNRGTCYVKDGKAYCSCTDRYSGKNCETDKCASLECNNGGTCVIKYDNAICNCTERYTGKNCEKYKCSSLPCKNGGSCDVRGGKPFCICAERYSGNSCEIDKCSSLTCENGGSCDVKDGEALCICTDGYAGKNCETVVDQCANHVCENGGTCIVYKAIAKCLCRTPFSGDRCEIGRRDENKTLSQLEWVLCSIIVLLILITGCITVIRSFERRQIKAC